MLLRFLVAVALIGAVSAFDNPCKDKQTKGCDDLSCAKVFEPVGGDPSAKCYDPKDGDYAMTPLCMATCQTCCLDDKFNCDDDPIPGVDCPAEPDDDICSQFGDINFAHCKSSCGWCALDSKPCFDVADSCDVLSTAPGDLCNTSPEVSVQCEQTCGVCVSTTCFDKSARCPIWVENGFCIDPFYTDSKGDYCKKSCGMC